MIDSAPMQLSERLHRPTRDNGLALYLKLEAMLTNSDERIVTGIISIVSVDETNGARCSKFISPGAAIDLSTAHLPSHIFRSRVQC